MGIKGNKDIFPNGLIYQGVWDEPQFLEDKQKLR